MNTDDFFAKADSHRLRLAEEMPTEADCLRVLANVSLRLRDLGWNDAIYCPKDGSVFDAIEFGSTGIQDCHYSGEWPDGGWWAADGGDLWPSHPIMYRKRRAQETPTRQRQDRNGLGPKDGGSVAESDAPEPQSDTPS